MKTCNIVATFHVGNTKVDKREWRDVDIMKTAHSRGWTTRYFNTFLKKAPTNKNVIAEWECVYNDPEHPHRFTGKLVGTKGVEMQRRGVFEYD